jgi:hypothetical protein
MGGAVMISTFAVSDNVSWVASGDLDHRINPAYYFKEAIESSRWIRDNAGRTATLESCSSLTTDGVHKTPDYVETGVPFLTATNVTALYLDSEKGFKNTTKNAYEDSRRGNCAPESQDVLICKSGKPGTAAAVPANLPFSCLHSVAFVRLLRDANPFYAAAFLNSIYGQSQVDRFQKGAVQPMLHLEEIEEMKIILPPREVQDAIGNKVRNSVRLRELVLSDEDQFNSWLNKACRASDAAPSIVGRLSHIPARTVSDEVWIDDLDAADRVDPWPFHIAPRQTRQHLASVSTTRQFGDFFEAVSDRQRFVLPLGTNTCYVSVLDVYSVGHVDWAAAAETRYSSAGVEPLAGDIVFSTLNPQESRVAVIPKAHKGTTVGSTKLAALRLLQDGLDVPYLLAAILRSQWIRVQASFLTRSSSLSRRRLHEGDFNQLMIPWADAETHELNQLPESSITGRTEAEQLVRAAIHDVETVVEGTTDVGLLLRESFEMQAWLDKNTDSLGTE